MMRARPPVWSGIGRALALPVLIVLATPALASACSVCFGDPNSDLAKGAVRGVAFMIGVTSCVLIGIASVTGVWIVRARRIARSSDSATGESAQT